MKPHRIFSSLYPNPSFLAAIAIALALFSPAIRPLQAQTPATPAASPPPPTQAAAPAPAQADPKAATKPTPKEAREAEINAEAQQLYQLAQELKVEVDKSNKDTLSLAVVKKAEEIEKLARTLKQNMRVE